MGRYESDDGEVVWPHHYRGRWIAGSLVVVVVLAASITVWARNISAVNAAPTARCAEDNTALIVTTPVANAPAIKRAAAQFAQADASGCSEVTIVEQSDDQTLTDLAAGKGPHVWVANGHSWLAAARANGTLIRSQADVASSPVVLAMPTEAANAHRWSHSATSGTDQILSMINVKRSWQADTYPQWGPFTLRFLNVSSTGAGVDAFAALTEGMVKDASADLSAAAQDPWALMSLRRAMAATPDAGATLPYSEADSTVEAMAMASAVVATEQSVVEYHNISHKTPVSAIALGKPSRSVVTIAAALKDTPTIKASSFVHALTEVGEADWAASGLRSIDGKSSRELADRGGLPSDTVSSVETSAPAVLEQAAKTWQWAHSQGSTLAVVDWSSSMSTPFPGTNTSRHSVVINSVFAAGVPYVRDDDLFGATIFHTVNNTPMIKPLVPMGPSADGSDGAPGTLRTAVEGHKAVRVGGSTPLYSAIVSGVTHIMDNYSDGMVNNLLVVTDGRNDIAGGPTRAEVISRINAVKDPDRVLHISLVGIGVDADMEDLRAIAQQTGAVVTQISSPSDIDTVVAQSLFFMQ